jgi:hypothetical protein
LRWLSDNREQIIAEGKAALEAGEKPVLPVALHADQQASVEGVRMEHPYEEAVNKWSNTQETWAVAHLHMAVEGALGRTAVSLNMHELRKFGESMRLAGWRKRRRSEGNIWVKEKL